MIHNFMHKSLDFILVITTRPRTLEQVNKICSFTNFLILGFSTLHIRFSQFLFGLAFLGFSLDWALSSIPGTGYSRLQLGLDALGFNSGWMLSASSPAGCSLSFSSTQMGGCTCKALRCQSQNWFNVHQT